MNAKITLALAGALVAAGCSAVGSLRAADASRDELLEARPVPVLSTALADEFPPGYGLRIGLASSLAESRQDMPARPVIGGYGHLLETDAGRVEVSVDLAIDTASPNNNRYFAFRGDYMGFLGRDGTYYWRAGGGGIMETTQWHDGDTVQDNYVLLEAGGGAWFKMREGIMYVNATYQVPTGEDNESPAHVFFLNVAYEY